MKSSYYHVKKHRKLKRTLSFIENNTEKKFKQDSINDEETENAQVTSDQENRIILPEVTINEDNDYLNEININIESDESLIETENTVLESSEIIALNSPEKVSTSSLSAKLKDWALRNIGTLRNVVITDLLNILRDEGHFDLPLTAATLLGTRHYRPTCNMLTNRGTIGSYVYCGIVRNCS